VLFLSPRFSHPSLSPPHFSTSSPPPLSRSLSLSHRPTRPPTTIPSSTDPHSKCTEYLNHPNFISAPVGKRHYPVVRAFYPRIDIQAVRTLPLHPLPHPARKPVGAVSVALPMAVAPNREKFYLFYFFPSSEIQALLQSQSRLLSFPCHSFYFHAFLGLRAPATISRSICDLGLLIGQSALGKTAKKC
jgi:hypothetical protein